MTFWSVTMMSDWTILINNIPDVLHVGDLITDLMDENDWEYHISASSTDFDSSFSIILGRFPSREDGVIASNRIAENYGYNGLIIRMPRVEQNSKLNVKSVSAAINELKEQRERGQNSIELLTRALEIIEEDDKLADEKRRVIFTTFKDSEPELAIPIGLDYSKNNADPNFFKVLLTRLLRNNRESEALELLLHRLRLDGECAHLNHLSKLLFDYERDSIFKTEEDSLEDCTLRLQEFFIPASLDESTLHRMLFTELRKHKLGIQVRHEIAEKHLDDWKNDEDFMRELSAFEFQRGNFSKSIKLLSDEFKDTRTITALAKYRSHASLLENGWIMPPSSPPSKITKKNLIRYLVYTSLPHHGSGYATRTHNLLRSLNRGAWLIEGVTRYGYPWVDKNLQRKEVEDCEIIDDIIYYRQFNEKSINLLTIEKRLIEAADTFVEHCRVNGVPEVIHAASNWMNGIVACHAGRILGIPVIYEVRGRWELTRIARDPDFRGSEHDRMIRRMEVEVANACDQVLVITTGLKKMLIDEGVEPEKITIAPNGVDTEVFQPIPRDEELADQLGIGEGPIIGYVGSLVHYEGLDLLLKAVGKLKQEERFSSQILIVGDGDERKKLEEMAADEGIADSCVFTGRVDFKDIDRYYSLIDIAPFPRTSHDVCEMVSPLKPFEAMAMGKRVICSNVAALEEIIEEGVNGELFEKGDVTSLTNVLGNVLDDYMAGNEGGDARDWVEKNRTWSRTADTITSIYDDVKRERPKTVLIAGHDLKFIDSIAREMMNRGFNILQDKWLNHTAHDEEKSRGLLSAADVVICEWALGNSVWYSNNVRDDQSLFIRFHRQEIETDFPSDINWDSVDNIIFIAPLIQREAVEKFSIPKGKDMLLPNSVDTLSFVREKSDQSMRTLGLMGMVPQMKRFDRALDILHQLNKQDLNFQLRIKGKQPTDYLWMKDRPEEMEWYETQMKRLEEDPHLIGKVHFDGWGNDVPEWFSKVGFILSVSDFEGSHQAVAEGAATGAFPIIIEWPGASEVYPQDWCVDTINDAVDMIIKEIDEVDKIKGEERKRKIMSLIENELDLSVITSKWIGLFSDK